MESREFVECLVEEMEGVFRQLGEHRTPEAESKGELEASEIAAFCLPATPEIDAKAIPGQRRADELRNLAEKPTGLHPIPVSRGGNR